MERVTAEFWSVLVSKLEQTVPSTLLTFPQHLGLTTRHRLPAGLWVSASLHCSPSPALQACSKLLDSSLRGWV